MPTKPAAKKPATKAKPKATASKTAKPKKAAAPRPVAKVSPLKGMPIADWLKQHVTGWQVEAVSLLLDVAAKAVPEASVSIKWSQPTFELKGPFAFIKPAKAHVTFGFMRGAELSSMPEAFGTGERMRHLKFTSVEEIDPKLIAKLVKEAAKLNRAE